MNKIINKKYKSNKPYSKYHHAIIYYAITKCYITKLYPIGNEGEILHVSISLLILLILPTEKLKMA